MFHSKFVLVMLTLSLLLFSNNSVAQSVPTNPEPTAQQEETIPCIKDQVIKIDRDWTHLPKALTKEPTLNAPAAARLLFGSSRGKVEYGIIWLETIHPFLIDETSRYFLIKDGCAFESFGGGLANEVDQIVVWYPFIDTNNEAWAWEFVLTKSPSGNRLIVPKRGGDPMEMVLSLKVERVNVDWHNPEELKNFITLSLGFPK